MLYHCFGGFDSYFLMSWELIWKLLRYHRQGKLKIGSFATQLIGCIIAGGLPSTLHEFWLPRAPKSSGQLWLSWLISLVPTDSLPTVGAPVQATLPLQGWLLSSSGKQISVKATAAAYSRMGKDCESTSLLLENEEKFRGWSRCKW